MPDIPDDNWSERDDRNAEVAPFGWPPGLPAQIELIGQMMMGAIKRFWNRANPVYLTTGTADAYVVTTEGQTVTLNLYEIIRVRIDRANTTTTPTLKFAKTNARTIVKVTSTGIVPLIAGDMQAGRDHSFWFNGTNFVLSNPATIDSAVTVGVLKTANNLSELTATASTARTNIGLGNVDNTSDVNKPVSTAQQAAIDLKANIASPTFTGVPAAPTASQGNNSTQLATTAYADAGLATKLALAGGTMTGPINLGYQALSNPAGSLLQGYLFGLTLSNDAGDATNSIDIAAGSAAASASPFALMTLASALGKNLNASWALGGVPGTTVGGLDTGSIANGTYHVYLMQRSDTGVVDACFSTSASAPTTGGAIPAAYNRFRRIGSIIRTAAAIVAFTQNGDVFRRAAALDRNSTAALASSLFALSVPLGIVVQPIISNLVTVNVSSSTTNQIGNATSGAIEVSYQTAISTATGGGDNITTLIGGWYTNTSGQIYYAVIISAGSIVSNQLRTIGWIDPRGRT